MALKLFPSLFLLFLLNFLVPCVLGFGVFEVKHKFLTHAQRRNIHLLRAHDVRRHDRMLSAVDLPLGGNGLPSETGLYFAQIGIGTPSKDYYVQVDTGSDILWVNCVSCSRCPKKSDLGIELTLYDPKGSQSGTLVTCEESFCLSAFGGDVPGCTSSNTPCQYSVLYGDGSSTMGYFVTDLVQYNQVTGNSATRTANASVTFGCGAQQGGDLGSSSEALDGILGFGQSNTSFLSQLASAGKVKKVFSHCLDTVKGGGIFAIGDVVQPKMKTTPLVPDQQHYNVNLTGIEVGGSLLQLPSDLFETGDKKGTIVDSGTTLTYLPEAAYKAIWQKVFQNHPDISFQTVQEFSCFEYTENIDDGFPEVVFNFENNLTLHVHPHDYLFQNEKDYCFGFQNGGLQSKDGKDIFLLGDLVLSSKLVVYDLENQVIGWTDYNCSSSIKVQDDKTNAIYTVGAHNVGSAWRSESQNSLLLLLLTIVLIYMFI
ncbi:Eukaryotic aspartyl protease family protein [Rhynchospora pubera]|uniref:Eukaryotic aspartyl protease family protein n=1 Tax=Rhynchospora pubera TaxID=906938 RepID=A0AAV8FB71_9POAL|nr:Eukaryotic aspartyl protease family protein [Rhynchospora pubera]